MTAFPAQCIFVPSPWRAQPSCARCTESAQGISLRPCRRGPDHADLDGGLRGRFYLAGSMIIAEIVFLVVVRSESS